MDFKTYWEQRKENCYLALCFLAYFYGAFMLMFSPLGFQKGLALYSLLFCSTVYLPKMLETD